MLLTPAGVSTHAAEFNGSEILTTTTSKGFEAKTADGQYAVKIGGRVQADYNDYDGVVSVPPGDHGEDAFIRRSRIEIKAHANNWDYELAYNINNGGSVDAIFGTYNGWGKMSKLTLGQQKENFGMDDTGSSKWITAIERSMASEAFDTGHSLGARFHGANQQFTYSLGVFKNGFESNNSDVDTSVTGRIVVRPLMDDTNLIHLGLGMTERTGVAASYSARLGARGGQDGGGVSKVRARVSGASGDRSDYNLEAAARFGALHMMAEYFEGEIDVDNSAHSIDADGYYAQVGYVLTGEYRDYKIDSGTFEAVKPTHPAGAWELFARYDHVDVNNPAPISVSAEKADSCTFGVNWYLNSTVRLSADYVHVNTDNDLGGEDDGDAVLARLQVAF
jgi:phosphate-selective porin OprO/OprP